MTDRCEWYPPVAPVARGRPRLGRRYCLAPACGQPPRCAEHQGMLTIQDRIEFPERFEDA